MKIRRCPQRETPHLCRECSAECSLWARCNAVYRAEPNVALEQRNAERASRQLADMRTRLTAELATPARLTEADMAAIDTERYERAITRMSAYERNRREAEIQRESWR